MRSGILSPAACRWAAAVVCGVLCFALAVSRSSDPKSLGTLEEAKHASVRGASAISGTSVYAGDAVKTDEQGTVRLRLGKGKLYLSASSSASLEQRAGLATVTLAQGSATFSLPDPTQFELETPVGVLRASGTKLTRGQVRITKANEVEVSASHGDLVLDSDGEYYTLPQGKTFRIMIVADSNSQAGDRSKQKSQATQHPKRELHFFPVQPTNLT